MEEAGENLSLYPSKIIKLTEEDQESLKEQEKQANKIAKSITSVELQGKKSPRRKETFEEGKEGPNGINKKPKIHPSK